MPVSFCPSWQGHRCRLRAGHRLKFVLYLQKKKDSAYADLLK